jgi:hypothetical protein
MQERVVLKYHNTFWGNREEAVESIHKLEERALRFMEAAERNGVINREDFGPMKIANGLLHDADLLRKHFSI